MALMDKKINFIKCDDDDDEVFSPYDTSTEMIPKKDYQF